MRKKFNLLPLSPEKRKKAEYLVEKLKKKYQKGLKKSSHLQPVYDVHYLKAMKHLEDSPPDLHFSGVLNLSSIPPLMKEKIK